MPLKGTSPCVIGTLADVRSGRANLTAAGLQRKDFFELNGKLVSPQQYLPYVAKVWHQLRFKDATGREWKDATRAEKRAHGPVTESDQKAGVSIMTSMKRDGLDTPFDSKGTMAAKRAAAAMKGTARTVADYVTRKASGGSRRCPHGCRCKQCCPHGRYNLPLYMVGRADFPC